MQSYMINEQSVITLYDSTFIVPEGARVVVDLSVPPENEKLVAVEEAGNVTLQNYSVCRMSGNKIIGVAKRLEMDL